MAAAGAALEERPSPDPVNLVRPSLEALQDQLGTCYLQLVTFYGWQAASQALGHVLSHLPLDSRASEEAQHGSKPVQVPAPGTPAAEDAQGPKAKSALTKLLAGRTPSSHVHTVSAAAHPRGMWKRAVAAAQKAGDPWASRNLHALPMEHCIRHRYAADKRHWVTDDVLVKIESKPFAAGAMRECFAMKKISTFSTNIYHDWRKAQNCVAKRYKKLISNELYFADILVQMDAKNMGEEYNRTNPPKQVDIMQAAIVEFPDRPGSPIYAIEQLMTGDYVKYNSNSGFVLGDDLLRYTPQAFSHFTWCWSKGQRICVDIQGVGDLYTDPQIHTLDGEAYGDGNLALRGVALFFRSHQCNPLCARLHLKPFERCAPDVKAQGYTSDSSTRAASVARSARTLVPLRANSLKERLRSMQRRASAPPQPHTQDDVMTMLASVPTVESPDSLVHLEVARVYAEVVLLPDLRPDESPEDALKGGLFHLLQAARQGCVMALTMLARMHTGLEPASTAFGHLYKAAHHQGELVPYSCVAWRAALLAAQRGVGGAAAAVAYGYAHGKGLADGVLTECQPSEAVRWYRRALEIEAELAALTEAQAASEGGDGGPPGGLGGVGALAIVDTIVEESEEGSVAGSVPGTPGESDGFLCTSPLERQGTLDSQTTDMSAEVGIITARLAPMRAIPSAAFILNQRLAAEEEAAALPHAALQKYEIHAALGKLLLDSDSVEAAEHFNEAAELASGAGKGKLAQSYFELAAQAESM